MKAAAALTVAALFLGSAASTQAQIVVSANDGKQLRPGEAASTRTADSVSVIDMRSYPPKTIGTVQAPASMIGAPKAVAVAKNSSFALVSATQRLNAAGTIELDDTVSVIDLATPSAPKVIQTVKASPGASGVSINRAGTLALVASTGDDTITIFTISGKTLTPAGKLQLPAKTRPTDVVIAPDGKTGLIVGQGAGKLLKIAINGSAVTLTGVEITPGIQPYGAVYSPDGRFSYNTNLGGRPLAPGATPPERGSGPRIGTVSSVNLATNAVESFDAGATPEHAAISPDGRWLAVVVANGSAAAPGTPGYNPHGLLQIYRVNGAKLTRVAEANSGQWCQGAIFSDDGKTVLLQCGMAKTIEVYRFDGKTLTQDAAATLKFDARPGSIASAKSQ